MFKSRPDTKLTQACQRARALTTNSGKYSLDYLNLGHRNNLFDRVHLRDLDNFDFLLLNFTGPGPGVSATMFSAGGSYATENRLPTAFEANWR